MTRCCVPGCDTGTSAEILRTRKTINRNKATFLLPADYVLFKKWKKVLGLKYYNYNGRIGRVCELHFNEVDIIRFYYKKLENGTIQQLTFSRPTLKKETIPLSIPRREDLLPSSLKIKKTKKKMLCKVQNNNQNNTSDESERLLGLKRKSFTKDNNIPEKIPRKNNAKKAKKFSNNYEKRSYKRQIKTPENILILSTVKKCRSPTYDFNTLLYNLKRKNIKLPKAWKFSIEDNDTVNFSFIVEFSKIFLMCILKRDTSVQIRAFNKNVTETIEFKFLSQAHLVKNLVELQKVLCCKGILYKRFSKSCQGFIQSKKEYNKFGQFDRCVACKKVWNNIIISPRRSHKYVKLFKHLHSIRCKTKSCASTIKAVEKKKDAVKNIRKFLKQK